MLRYIVIDDNIIAVKFDNSASYKERVKALGEKNEWLERTLRKEIVKIEKLLRKAKK